MYRTIAEAIAFLKHELVPMDKVTDAPNYLGDTWPGWYIAYSGFEGEPLDECNMVAFQKRLSEAGFQKEVDYLETSLGNWCGPSSIFLLVKGTGTLELSKEIREELADYPCLDDSLASEMGVFDDPFEQED